MSDTEQTISIDINGRTFTPDELTFAEQRKLRAKVRELMGDPKASVAESDMMDFVPAFVWLVMLRDDPDITFEEVDEMKPADIMGAEEESGPTKPAAKRKPAARGAAKK